MNKIVLCWCSNCGCSWGHIQDIKIEKLEKNILSPCCLKELIDIRPFDTESR